MVRGAGRSVWSGVLSGIGLAAFVDETAFHQLLHWHHFYDRSTPDVGLVSDGLFHAFGFVAVVAGLCLLPDLWIRQALVAGGWVGGVLLGAGACQVYDGQCENKVFGMDQ